MFARSYEDLLEAPMHHYQSESSRMSSSMSPSPPHLAPPSNGHSLGPSSGVNRRPPRKSTLTQQQKNQKRQRATQDQLSTLEIEFNKNPTPTAIVRDRIAQEINMTPRSVQIWFQNRRAKIKQIAKKSIETGEECERISESVRLYLANQNPELKGLHFGPDGRPAGGMMDPGAGKIVIHHFHCRSLTVGSWRRIGLNAMDLVIFYSPEKATMTYYINNDAAGYKIEYPFAYIKSIELETLNVPMAPLNTHGGQQQGQLVIQLLRPPHFFMDTSGQGGFVQCGDFTEDQQATQIMTHILGGNSKSLQSELSKLLNVDAYQNRHLQATMFDPPQLSITPHSPLARPSSASDFARPSLMQKEARGFAIPQRGHRRQRSRSVPNAMDLSLFHQPMPSFHFDEAVMEPDHEHHETMFAPAPLHPNMSNNLRIDTTASGFLDYRQSYPLSATTAGSQSEYAPSPGFPSHGVQSSSYTTSTFNGLPWLSPLMTPSGIPPSVSPLSQHSQNGDPIIASGSPPLIDRSGSAELFPLHHPEQQTFHEEGLSDLYAKQTLVLPYNTPPMEDAHDLDTQHLQPYSLNPLHQISVSPDGNPM